MIGGIWCLQNAIVTALALYSFPKRRNKSSRFDNFISSLLSNSTADGLERVKNSDETFGFGMFHFHRERCFYRAAWSESEILHNEIPTMEW